MKQFGDKATAEEEAKSAIQRAEWKAKELATVRRIKLEELLTTLNECNEYLLRETNWWYESAMPTLTGNPAIKLRAIALLYFPEVDIVPFQQAFSLCRDKALEGKREIEGAKCKGSDEQNLAQQRAIRNYMENGYNYFAAVATAMEKQAAPLMHQLLELSVAPLPTPSQNTRN